MLNVFSHGCVHDHHVWLPVSMVLNVLAISHASRRPASSPYDASAMHVRTRYRTPFLPPKSHACNMMRETKTSSISELALLNGKLHFGVILPTAATASARCPSTWISG